MCNSAGDRVYSCTKQGAGGATSGGYSQAGDMGAGGSREENDPELSDKWTADGIQRQFHGSLNELDEALFEAVADGDEQTTEALLKEGANVNHLSADHDWASPVIVAAQEGSLECLRLLLAVSTVVDTINRPDRFGYTACHTAAHWNQAGCLQALLEAGAQPLLLAKGVGTAAHVAAARDNEACLHVLLATGVDVDAVDADGRSVYDVAVESASHRCVAMIDAWEDLHKPAGDTSRAKARRPRLRGEAEALRPVVAPPEDAV